MRRRLQELSGAVLAAFIVLAGIVSANASGISHVPMQRDGAAPLLYASDQTKRELGAMAEYLPQWASMDVLVVSRQDLARQDDDFYKRPGPALDRFTDSIDGFPVERLAREGLERSLARNAADASAHGFPMPARLAGERPVCAISLPDMSSISTDGLVATVTDVSRATADYVPGSARAWQLIVVAHEIAHCRHSYDDQRDVVGLQFEREADQFAIDIYRKYGELLLGPAHNDPAVPDALVAFRGIASLHSGFVLHSTSAALSADGSPLGTIDDAWLIRAKLMAQNAVWNMAQAGAPDRRQDTNRPPPAAMYEAARTLYDSGYFDSTPVQRRYVETFLAGAENFFPSYFGVPAGRQQSMLASAD